MAGPEIEVSAELVRALVEDQHPDLAHHPVTFGARGWANQIWRLGDDLAVRLPWQAGADAPLLDEHRWVPTLAPHLPLAVPVPQRLGRPSERYPRPWIVTTWVPGTPADRAPAVDGAATADALAAFLASLHRPAPPEAPVGRGRGGSLQDVARGVSWSVRRLRSLVRAVPGVEPGSVPDRRVVRAVWDDAVSAPAWTEPAHWLHGDLHPANVLTTDGSLCGVVDFGDLCAGDPASTWPRRGSSSRTATSTASGASTRGRGTTPPGAGPGGGPSGGRSGASSSPGPTTPGPSPAGVRRPSPRCDGSPRRRDALGGAQARFWLTKSQLTRWARKVSM